MTAPPDSTTGGEIAERVRWNAGPVAVAAGCLLLFGFGGGFIIPPVTDLFTLGDAVFNYTLRIGGVMMGVAAVCSLTGKVRALQVDALASGAIGSMLVFSGLAMIAGGGGLNVRYVLYAVFGGMFVSASIRGWREYSSLIPMADSGKEESVINPLPIGGYGPSADLQETNAAQPPLAPPVVAPDTFADDRSPAQDITPAPDGFLASFADEEPPRGV